MTAYFGSKKIKDIYKGSIPISKVYKGSVLVYQKTKAAAQNIFIAILLSWNKDTPKNNFAYSYDGITWTESTLPIANDCGNTCSRIAYGNGKFVVVGLTQSAVSTDGKTWSVGGTLPSANWNECLAYGNGKYIQTNSTSKKIASSENGTTWEQNSTTFSTAPIGITYGNGLFVLSNFAYSEDGGVTWTENSTMSGKNGGVIKYFNGKFINCSVYGSNMIMYTSTDGKTWTSKTFTGIEGFTDLTYHNGKYYLLTRWDKMYISTDLSTWTEKTAPYAYTIAYGAGKLVITGAEQGKTYYSTNDGDTWTEGYAFSQNTEDDIWVVDYFVAQIPDASFAGGITLADVLSATATYTAPGSSTRRNHIYTISNKSFEYYICGEKHSFPAGNIAISIPESSQANKWVNSVRYFPVYIQRAVGSTKDVLVTSKTLTAVGNSLPSLKIISGTEPSLDGLEPEKRGSVFWYNTKDKVMYKATVSNGVYSWNKAYYEAYLGDIKCTFGSTLGNMTYEFGPANNAENWNQNIGD